MMHASASDWCGACLQPDYIVALKGSSGFSVMVAYAHGRPDYGPGPGVTIPSCYGADVVLAADFNSDGHMGAH
jgi:hypothetical protein